MHARRGDERGRAGTSGDELGRAGTSGDEAGNGLELRRLGGVEGPERGDCCIGPGPHRARRQGLLSQPHPGSGISAAALHAPGGPARAPRDHSRAVQMHNSCKFCEKESKQAEFGLFLSKLQELCMSGAGKSGEEVGRGGEERRRGGKRREWGLTKEICGVLAEAGRLEYRSEPAPGAATGSPEFATSRAKKARGARGGAGRYGKARGARESTGGRRRGQPGPPAPPDRTRRMPRRPARHQPNEFDGDLAR